VNRSHSIWPSEKLRCIGCRGADRFDSGQTPLRHRNQFVGISPLQFGSGCVRTIRDLDAKLFRLPHSLLHVIQKLTGGIDVKSDFKVP
jgi:hypothetical protein